LTLNTSVTLRDAAARSPLTAAGGWRDDERTPLGETGITGSSKFAIDTNTWGKAAMEDDAVIEQDGALIVPAWIGPARMFVLTQGLAYRFGLFILTADNLAFAANEQILMQEHRADVKIKWPRILWGGGFYVFAPVKRHAICFGMPFTNVPPPNQGSIARSAAALGAISALGFTAGQDWQPGGVIVSNLDTGVAALRRPWHGRSVGARVRAALAR
jgi:hypothetical protein